MGLFSWSKKTKEKTTNQVEKKERKVLPEKLSSRVITCPYCFKEFRHDQVCFLSTEHSEELYYSEEALKEVYGEDSDFDKLKEKNDLDRRFQRRSEDEQLEQFWRPFGGLSETLKHDLDSPLVTPENAAAMTLNGYEKDNDGFVVSAVTKLGKQKTEKRLCPYCHNHLPKGYGKYETKFISIVGVTNSGKTVYLHQLLSQVPQWLTQVSLTQMYGDEEIKKMRSIQANGVLPSATTDAGLQLPMMVTISKRDPNSGKTSIYTLVFYDIAGENCTDVDRMGAYGPYVSHADGIIMLIDPDQFPKFQAQAMHNGDQYSSTSVLYTMCQSFLTEKIGASGKVEIPVAVVISKSDSMVNYVEKHKQSIFKSIDHTVCGNVFNLTEYQNVHNLVKGVVRDYDKSLHDTVVNLLDHPGFFAVSSLGCDTTVCLAPQNRQDDGDIYNLKDGIEAKRIKKKLDESLQDGDTFTLYYDEETKTVSEDGCGIAFNVRSGELSMDGMKYRVGKRTVAEPKPARIEEPFQWLLWRFGLASAGTNGIGRE